MKKISVLLIVLFAISIQYNYAQKIKFGKVSKEELEEKFYPLDSTANAAYLYKYRKTYYEYNREKGFYLVTDIHERIKIYNKEGFDKVTKSILLYKTGSNKEKVTKLKGYTFNLIDDKVEEIKLKNESIFNTEYNKYRNQVKFTMPDIKIGSVVEYKYSIVSPFMSNVDEFVFQDDIPIRKLDAKFESPEYLNFKVNTKGFLSVIPKTETKKGRLEYKNKVPLSENRAMDTRTHYRQGVVEYIKNVNLYSLNDIPALRDEPYVNNINNYRSAVKYELSYTKFPNSTIKYYNTNWDDVTKSIYKSVNFGEQLEKTSYFKEELSSSINMTAPIPEKISLVFQYAKNKIKWNGYYGKYTSKGVRKAYKEGTGNVAEINLALVAMLREAGLNANPILVSTRSHGIPLFPTSDGFNYVIAGVEIQNGVILLDATEQYGVPNVLPLRDLNWQGRIVRKNGSSAPISLFPKKHTVENIFINAKLDEEGLLSGVKRSTYTTLNALNFRNNKIKINEDDLIAKLEQKYNDIEINEFKISNKLKLGKPIVEIFKFESEDAIDIIGDKMYISPMLFLTENANPFKLENREFPVDYGTPWEDKISINLKIPEGYKVESIPEKMAIGLPDELGSFKFVTAQKNDKIQILCSIKMNSSIIAPQYYPSLRKLYKGIIDKQAENIVLSKI